MTERGKRNDPYLILEYNDRNFITAYGSDDDGNFLKTAIEFFDYE